MHASRHSPPRDGDRPGPAPHDPSARIVAAIPALNEAGAIAAVVRGQRSADNGPDEGRGRITRRGSMTP